MQRIILIGFMGVGKTTLGKKVANKLNIPFIDSDHEIEAHYQKSIGQIFADQGESYFRKIEEEYIYALDLRDDFVLATGGGMPCFGKNMDLLNEIGTTFYLERSPKELTHRLVNAKTKRPLIVGMEEDELLSFVDHKLKEREEYYRKSNVILSRDEQTPEQIIQFTEHLQLNPLQKS